MGRALRWSVLVMGLACIGIGAFHLVLGIDSVPGEGLAGATVDSRERFYGALFLGYGALWTWAARQVPVPSRLVRWLSAVLLLGGMGRVVSIAVHGWPQWFQVVLTAIELLLPPIFLALAPADERDGLIAA
jgi:hypothetical protein